MLKKACMLILEAMEGVSPTISVENTVYIGRLVRELDC